MLAEILATGDEILDGALVDSNSAFIASTLEEHGISVNRHHTVGDDMAILVAALHEIGSRATVALVTGGLGPTLDDLSREAAARAAGVELTVDERALADIEGFFRERGRAMTESHGSIDRRALISRHNPVVRAPDPYAPLSVGNGEFAFTVDITGLQSYPAFYTSGVPLGTQSQWGWHAFPNLESYCLDDAQRSYDSHGRPVPYPSAARSPAGQWLRASPHRLDLARIGFQFSDPSGARVEIGDLCAIRQELDLWSGTLYSVYEVDGMPIQVWTWCHPAQDAIAVRAESPLITAGRLRIRVAFPYGSSRFGGEAGDWEAPDAHWTGPTGTFALGRGSTVAAAGTLSTIHRRWSSTRAVGSRPAGHGAAKTSTSLATATGTGSAWPTTAVLPAISRSSRAGLWATGGAVTGPTPLPHSATLWRSSATTGYLSRYA